MKENHLIHLLGFYQYLIPVKNLKNGLLQYCSRVVWLTGITSKGSPVFRVWQLIHLLKNKLWGFMKVHLVINEIFCPQNKWIGTLIQPIFQK